MLAIFHGIWRCVMNEDRIVRMTCNSSPILIPEHVRYCRSVQSEPSAYVTHRHPSKLILVAALAALSRIKLGDVVSSIATARCEHVCWLATVATLEALGECGLGSRHQGVTSTADVLLLTLFCLLQLPHPVVEIVHPEHEGGRRTLGGLEAQQKRHARTSCCSCLSQRSCGITSAAHARWSHCWYLTQTETAKTRKYTCLVRRPVA